MQNLPLTISTSLVDLDPNHWFAEIDNLYDSLGFFEQLGPAHCAGFLEAGNNLLVTFENAESIRAHNPGAQPRGFAFTQQDGWSHLALISFHESWFRDKAVYDFFDRMVDDGFFEDFEKVVFHGTDGGGYAAAAFSVAAPGSTVIALRPQAALDPKTAGWDPRYKAQRMHDFSERYGYAPEMIDAAKQVFIAFDPVQRLDAMHAALFRKPHVVMLPCTLLGTQLDQAFDRLGIHDVMIRLAMEGKLCRVRFSQLLRARRYDQAYMQTLVIRLIDINHPGLARIICLYYLRRRRDVFFIETLNAISKKAS